MIDNIGLHTPNPPSVDLSQLYQSAELPVNGPAPRTVRQSELYTSAEIAIDGDHSFQANVPEAPALNINEMEAPDRPMPLQEAREKHDAEIQDDRLGLGENCPAETRQALEKMADDLGEHGVDLMQTLTQTHAFKARMQTSSEPLNQEEIEQLENIASDLHQEMKEGLLTADELLTRANAKVFKLTSMDDMLELLTRTNNTVNEITAKTGFEEYYQQAMDHMEENIQDASDQLVHFLKTGSDVGDNLNAVMDDLSLFPKQGQNEFDEEAFTAALVARNNGNLIRNREQILTAARDLFTQRTNMANLSTAFQELKATRSQVLGLDSGKNMNIAPKSETTVEDQTKAALKTAADNLKRLQHAFIHPGHKLNNAHKTAIRNFFDCYAAGQKLLLPQQQHVLPGDAETALRQFNDSVEFHSQTLRTASQQLQFAQFQPVRDKLKQKQLDVIKKIWTNGGSQTVSGNIGLGIPGELLGIKANGTLALSYSYTIDCSNQQGAITTAKTKGLTVGLKVGSKKICSVNLSASKLNTNASIFATPEDFVEHNTNSMLSAILLKRSFLFQSPRNRRFERDKWIAMTNNNLLLNRLNVMGAVDTGDRVSNADLKSTKSIYTEMKTHTKMLKSELTALGGVLANTSSVSKAKAQMTINSNIFDMLQKDPRLYAKEKDSYFFNRACPAKSGMKPLEMMAHQEKVIQQVTEQRNLEKLEKYNQILYLALEDLHTEFQTYANVVNAYEMETADAPDIDKKLKHFFRVKDDESLEGRLLNIKTNYDKSRGASNRGEYLRAMMFTHARLNELYNKSAEGIKQLTGENIPLSHGVTATRMDMQQKAIEGFKNDYLNPPMRMDHKRHVQKFMTIKKHSEILTDTQESSTHVQIPGFPPGLDLKTVRKNVKKHHMRSQQVDTRTFEFGIDSGTIKHFNSIMTAIAGNCNDGTLPKALIKAGISDAVKIINTGKSHPGSGIVGSKKTAAFRVQVNCIMDKDDKLRFNNCTLLSVGGTNLSAQAGPVVAGGGVNRTNILGQFMGYKTLNYPFSRFFFTKQADGNPPESWNKFLDTNIKNVRKLFYNAMTPGSVAYKELTSYNDDGEVPNCQEDVNTFIKEQQVTAETKKSKRDPQHEGFIKLNDEELKTAFTDLMKLITKFEGQVTVKRLEAQN